VISVSPKASVLPVSGEAQDFTNPVTYTVAAEDRTITKTYTVTVEAAKNNAALITSFSVPGQTGTAVINNTANTISLTVPYGTAVTNLAPTINVSVGATVSPVSGTAQNFSSPITYTVTAEDGTTKTYTVTVQVALNSAKDITAFSITSRVSATGTISGTNITLTVPYGATKTNLSVSVTHTGAKVTDPNSTQWTGSPATFTGQNLNSPKTYTVTAEDGSTKIYTVTVNEAKRTEALITDFSVPGQIGPTTKTYFDVNTISLTVPYGTAVTSLVPTISVSPGATVSPATGTPRNFTNPVTYTVTAEDGTTTRTFTVTVNVAKNTAALITSFSMADVIGTINNAAGAITLTLPAGTDRTNLTPVIGLSPGATVNPSAAKWDTAGWTGSGTNPWVRSKTYTVTAEDGTTTKTYTVTVTVPKRSAKDITSFSVAGVSGVVGTNTVTVTVPLFTDVTSLSPSINVSAGATVNPTSGKAQDFNSPKTYTVRAEDGTTKSYTVTVTTGGHSSNITIHKVQNTQTGYSDVGKIEGNKIHKVQNTQTGYSDVGKIEGGGPNDTMMAAILGFFFFEDFGWYIF
jgi:hypothetical protein